MIEQLLSEKRTLNQVDCNSKKKVLEIVADAICTELTEIDQDQVFMSLIGRERLGSTGLGNGIAIPHCRIKGCKEPIAILLQLRKPVDFDSMDAKPVDIVFALLVPEDAEEDHLKILASIAEKMMNPSYLTGLRQASDQKSLYMAAIE